MEYSEIQDKLELRENQLREMATHLANQLQAISSKTNYITEMELKIQDLEKKIQKKESQIEQEIKDKEIITARIKGLEELGDITTEAGYYKKSKILTKEEKDETATYLDYYSKLKIQYKINSETSEYVRNSIENNL